MPNKTQPTDQNVTDSLASIEPAQKRADAIELDVLFQQVTGYNPVM